MTYSRNIAAKSQICMMNGTISSLFCNVLANTKSCHPLNFGNKNLTCYRNQRFDRKYFVCIQFNKTNLILLFVSCYAQTVEVLPLSQNCPQIQDFMTFFDPLPHMPILGSSNLAAKKKKCQKYGQMGCNYLIE